MKQKAKEQLKKLGGKYWISNDKTQIRIYFNKFGADVFNEMCRRNEKFNDLYNKNCITKGEIGSIKKIYAYYSVNEESWYTANFAAHTNRFIREGWSDLYAVIKKEIVRRYKEKTGIINTIIGAYNNNNENIHTDENITRFSVLEME